MALLIGTGLLAAAAGRGALTDHVTGMVVERFPSSRAVFEDLPGALVGVAGSDLHERIADLIVGDWTEPDRCRRMADRLAESAWVAQVHHVRRTSDAQFRVSCQYRLPYAMVGQGTSFLLIDRKGVRLPGSYVYDESFKLIQGVGMPAPEPGLRWSGDDLQAALAIIGILENEPFGGQISAVVVDNFRGRKNARQCHIELATDRPGGRIRWGSAPGLEIDENEVAQKLAILRENYRRTERLDAEHLVIDIVTFPDRFTIPG